MKAVAFKAFPLSTPNLPDAESVTLDERLKSLVSKSEVMIFIKGTADKPRCGFSRQLVEILNEINCKFQSFDILEDEEVRQGLKVFSNWPTYPQIYVDGALIGGLDIIKVIKFFTIKIVFIVFPFIVFLIKGFIFIFI